MSSLHLIRLVIFTLIAGITHSAIPRQKYKHNARKTRSVDYHNKLAQLDDAMIKETKVRLASNKIGQRDKETKGKAIASHLKLPNSIYKSEKKDVVANSFKPLKSNDNKQKKKATKRLESKLTKAKQDARVRNVQQKKQKQQSNRKKRAAVNPNSQKPSVKKKKVVVKEFPLDDILYRGKASNEANKFIRGNTKVGKPLELVYEYTREQDLNDIEEKIQRRFIEYSNLKT